MDARQLRRIHCASATATVLAVREKGAESDALRKGIDAYAATFGYEPDRSKKGFPSIEDAKDFVESFKPWELYGVHGATVESEVREEVQPT